MLISQQQIEGQLAPLLLEWYRQNARVLPFRTHSTPYRVWVSEIMLQQTRVAAALDHYNRFMQQLPTVQHLAECPEEKLMKLWEGLGYYSRARNLQKAAQIIVQQHGGELPADYKQLLALPGIGEYTAGAIASISFGLPVAAVDGNVLRVFARLYDDDSDILRPETKKEFTQRVLRCLPADAPGDFNQALMELGAVVCAPNGPPQCLACPVASICRGFAAGTAPQLPVKTPPKARKIQPITVLLVQDEQGRYLIQKRPEKGLLAGLWQPPLLEESATPDQAADWLAQQGITAEYRKPGKAAKHIFSHIEWKMQALCFAANGKPKADELLWATPEQLKTEYTLPNAFKAYKAQMTGEKISKKTEKQAVLKEKL